jgi:hypothetical protein
MFIPPEPSSPTESPRSFVPIIPGPDVVWHQPADLFPHPRLPIVVLSWLRAKVPKKASDPFSYAIFGTFALSHDNTSL